MKDYLITFTNAKYLKGRADREKILGLIDAYKELKGPGHRYKIYEFKDADGTILLNLYDIQTIFIAGGIQNAN